MQFYPVLEDWWALLWAGWEPIESEWSEYDEYMLQSLNQLESEK